VGGELRWGVGGVGGGDGMQRDWDEFQRGLPGVKGRGMGVDERYLFQSRNPYAAGMAEGVEAEQDAHGRESPTVKVGALACCIALGVAS
jgi:hypothetical protein